MGDRVVDCARLESVCAERHRGFESLPIRQLDDKEFIAYVIWPWFVRVSEIRTPFERWGALRARVNSEALRLEPKRSLDNPLASKAEGVEATSISGYTFGSLAGA